jgi:hypothetical protein
MRAALLTEMPRWLVRYRVRKGTTKLPKRLINVPNHRNQYIGGRFAVRSIKRKRMDCMKTSLIENGGY